jgi:hypothetical protein
MDLHNIYLKILKICKENYIDEPYIVGGIPRSLYINASNEEAGFDMQKYKDIDITTNDSDITRLGITSAGELGKGFRFFNDGHVSVYTESVILDFSSHFISSMAVEYVKEELNIKDKKLFEVYSRDFTINTLHKRFFEDEIFDLTNKGKEDLDKKILRTPVPARITLNNDFRRIYRAISFAARFGFKIDDEIIDYVKNNRDKFTGENKWVLKEAFMTSIIGEAINNDPDVTMYYLEEMNLLPTVPMSGVFKEELIKRRLVNKYLDDVINLSEYKLKTLDF